MRTHFFLALALAALVAGCAAPARPNAAGPDAADGTTTMPTLLSVSFDGTTAQGPAACTQGSSCVAPEVGGSSKVSQEVRPNGTLTAVDLVMTWSATTPATQTLTLGVSDGHGGQWTYVTASGGSPLKLQKSVHVPAGDQVFVYGNGYQCLPAPVTPCASASQAFHIQGTLTVDR